MRNADFAAIVEDFLLGECGFTREDQLILGLSGGPDSLCLFDLLATLRFTFTAAHLDHRLRTTSSAEAARVKALVEARGVPFVAREDDVREFAQLQRLSVEEAARDLRYRFLFSLAIQLEAKAVLVAHNAGDQVETLLMHLLRGAGLRGLRGLQAVSYLPQFSPKIPLVRPLLAVSKEEILSYCERSGLQPILDESNQDRAFLRNRIRLELLPTLETYNPKIRKVLLRSAEALSGEYLLVEKAVSDVWKEIVAWQSADSLALRREMIAGFSPGLRRAVVRRALAEILSGLREISFEATERAVGLIVSPPRSGRAELQHSLNLIHEGEFVWLTLDPGALPVGWWPQISADASYELEVPGELALPGGWSFITEIGSAVLGEFATGGVAPPMEYRVSVDPERLEHPLVVRTRRAGDRFAPLGLDGRTQKVSDFMINEKIPARIRAEWPLLFAGGELLWVPGYRISHTFRVTEATKRVVYLSLNR